MQLYYVLHVTIQYRGEQCSTKCAGVLHVATIKEQDWGDIDRRHNCTCSLKNIDITKGLQLLYLPCLLFSENTSGVQCLTWGWVPLALPQ